MKGFLHLKQEEILLVLHVLQKSLVVCDTLTQGKVIGLVLWVVYFPYSFYLQVSLYGNCTFHGPPELSTTLPGENISPQFKMFETKQIFAKWSMGTIAITRHTADLPLGFST